MPYSDVVPPGRIFEDYIPIHDGKMILLTPGRQKAEDVSEPPIFARPLTSGSFSGNVFWCYVRGFGNFERFATPDSSQLQMKRTSLDLCDLQVLVIPIA